MKTKQLICTAVLAMAASSNAVAQDAAADLNDPVVCRAILCDKSVSASEAAFNRSMQVFQQRRLLKMERAS